MKGDEIEALRARLDDLARRAGRLWTPLCSRFLTQEERSLAQRCARENGVLAAFDGGWEGAERSQCCFYPDGLEPDFTGVWLEVSWNAKFAAVDHRALLGSVMALGMDRSLLGDMVIEGDHAYIRAVPELAARLPQELTRVGSAAVKVRERSEPPCDYAPEGDGAAGHGSLPAAGQRVIQRHEDLSRQGDGMDSSRRGAGEPHGHRAGGSAAEG